MPTSDDADPRHRAPPVRPEPDNNPPPESRKVSWLPVDLSRWAETPDEILSRARCWADAGKVAPIAAATDFAQAPIVKRLGRWLWRFAGGRDPFLEKLGRRIGRLEARIRDLEVIALVQTQPATSLQREAWDAARLRLQRRVRDHEKRGLL